ncbi:helix-turn-helix domain-containing protein [Microbispora bryophytorum]|uniref:helix-turn-helix domain-containing protein n=1 Tax=Microbispora bryophytorum TaxID=1460882 RepID=UPI0037125D8E
MGRELRHYRQAVGLTQAQLAQKVHFSESLISGIETGHLRGGGSPTAADHVPRTDQEGDGGQMDLNDARWRKSSFSG